MATYRPLAVAVLVLVVVAVFGLVGIVVERADSRSRNSAAPTRRMTSKRCWRWME